MKKIALMLSIITLMGFSTSDYARPRGGRGRGRPRRSYSRRPYYRTYSRRPYRYYRSGLLGYPYATRWGLGPYWWWYANSTDNYYKNISDDYAQDTSGKTYWHIQNDMPFPVSVSTDRERNIQLKPGEAKKIYRSYDFGIIIETPSGKKALQSKNHILTISPDLLERLNDLEAIRAEYEREKQADTQK